MMNPSLWLIVIFLAWEPLSCRARPQESSTVYPVYRPGKELAPQPVSSQNATEPEKQKTDIEDIATVARASPDGPMLAPAVAAVADQLIDKVGAQMVDSDTRTPPKLKEIMKEKKGDEKTAGAEVIVDKIEANGKFEIEDERPALATDPSEGKASHTKKKEPEGTKGVAVPVIMDTDLEPPPKKLQKMPEVQKPGKEEKKKVGGKPQRDQTTTPSSGLSTWILLSDNREATTPSAKKPAKPDDKKRITTTKKPMKAAPVTAKPTVKPVTAKPTPKPAAVKKPAESDPVALTALEAMVKNQKKAQAHAQAQSTTVKPKVESTTKAPTKKPTETKKKPDKIYERIDIPETKDKVEIDLSEKKVVTLPPMLVVTMESDLEVTDSGSQLTTTEALETTTKKKKSSSKKRKKNKNRRRKPSKTAAAELELKGGVKTPKQPVGAQLYNFLSREIMPTVGLGLVGVLVTAGLAGLLGYNPFVGGSLPVRRTYESQHGYSPNKYYSYNTEYGDTEGGQSEEVLFREVLSGMPEDSRYGLTNSEPAYPETQVYSSQEQAFEAAKTPTDASYSYPETYGYSGGDKQDKYPVYNGETSYVYPEPSKDEATGAEAVSDTTVKLSAKYKSDTMERAPEALYRVSPESEAPYAAGESTVQGVSDQNWHRIGSPMDMHRVPHLEPGPRSLDGKKRSRRSAVSDSDNEIDFEGSFGDDARTTEAGVEPTATSAEPSETTTESLTTVDSRETTTGEAATTAAPVEGGKNETAPTAPTAPSTPSGQFTDTPQFSFMDILRRLAQFKLRLGLKFLKSTTDAFSKYLTGVQQKVEESIDNNYSNKSPFRTTNWASNFWRGREANAEDNSVRSKRSVDWKEQKPRNVDKTKKKRILNRKMGKKVDRKV